MIPTLLSLAICAGPTVPSKIFDPAFQRRCLDSTVRIRDKSGRLQGSGVVIGRGVPDSKTRNIADLHIVHVLTARHVLSRDGILVEGYRFSSNGNPTTNPLPKTRDWRQDTLDLAIVDFVDVDLTPLLDMTSRFPTANLFRLTSSYRDRFPVAKLASMDELGFSEDPIPVLSTGCTDGNWPTCREDRAVKKLLRSPPPENRPLYLVWETPHETTEGRSGGPLFDRSGKVVGICLAKQGGKGYYSHIDEITAFLKTQNFEWLVPSNSGKKDIK